METETSKEGARERGGGRSVIVRELGNGEPRCPVILSLIHKVPEVVLEHGVDPLRLTIRRRVKGSGRGGTDPGAAEPPSRTERQTWAPGQRLSDLVARGAKRQK